MGHSQRKKSWSGTRRTLYDNCRVRAVSIEWTHASPRTTVRAFIYLVAEVLPAHRRRHWERMVRASRDRVVHGLAAEVADDSLNTRMLLQSFRSLVMPPSIATGLHREASTATGTTFSRCGGQGRTFRAGVDKPKRRYPFHRQLSAATQGSRSASDDARSSTSPRSWICRLRSTSTTVQSHPRASIEVFPPH